MGEQQLKKRNFDYTLISVFLKKEFHLWLYKRAASPNGRYHIPADNKVWSSLLLLLSDGFFSFFASSFDGRLKKNQPSFFLSIYLTMSFLFLVAWISLSECLGDFHRAADLFSFSLSDGTHIRQSCLVEGGFFFFFKVEQTHFMLIVIRLGCRPLPIYTFMCFLLLRSNNTDSASFFLSVCACV